LHSYHHVSQLPHDVIGDRGTYPKRRRLDQHGTATIGMTPPGTQEAQSEQKNASLKIKSLLSELNRSYGRGNPVKERILTHMQQYLKDCQHKGASSRISIDDLARIQNSLLLHLGNAIVPQQRHGGTTSVNNPERNVKLTSDVLVTLDHLYQYAHGGILDFRCSDLERLLENTDIFSELLAMICFVLVPIKSDRSSLKQPMGALNSCINILNLMWNASTQTYTPTSSHHCDIKSQMISSEFLLMCLVRRVSSPEGKEDKIAAKLIRLLREMALFEEKGEPPNMGESAKQNMAVTFYTAAQLITEYRYIGSIKHRTDTQQGKMAADRSKTLVQHSNQILCQLFGWKDFTGMGSSAGSSQSKGTRKEEMMEHLFDQLQKEITLYHDRDIKRSHVAIKLLFCLASSQDMALLLVQHGPILKALKDIALLPHAEEGGKRDSVAMEATASLLQIASLSSEVSGSIQNDSNRKSGVSLLTQMLLDVASESPCIHIQHDALEGLHRIIATTTDRNMSSSKCFVSTILPQILKCLEKSQSAMTTATFTDGEFCCCCCSHTNSSPQKKSIMEWAVVRGEWVHWIMLSVLATHHPNATVTIRLPSRLVPLVFQIVVDELDHVLFHSYDCHDPQLSHPQELLLLLLQQFIRPLLKWSEIPQLRAFIVSTRTKRGDHSLLSCLTHMMTTMIQEDGPLANHHHHNNNNNNTTNENDLLVSVTKIVWNCSCDTNHCLEPMALNPKVREALIRVVVVTTTPAIISNDNHHAMAQRNAIGTICQLASTVTNRRLLASHCGLLTSLIRCIRSLPPDDMDGGSDAKLKVQLKDTISQLVPYM